LTCTTNLFGGASIYAQAQSTSSALQKRMIGMRIALSFVFLHKVFNYEIDSYIYLKKVNEQHTSSK